MTITALKLGTDHVKTYVGCTLEQAAMAAHAQDHGDYNTWDYQAKYSHLVMKTGEHTRTCGEWAVCGEQVPA